MSRGFDFLHQPVLLQPVLDLLSPHPDGCYVDCTLGGGGHAWALYQQLGPDGRLIGLDQDQEALLAAQARFAQGEGRAQRHFVHARFSDLPAVLDRLDSPLADGILADLGVSSWQLDSAQRGFSYQADGPLDMRMDASRQLTARQIVNSWPQAKLAHLLKAYGEERYAGSIARALVARRKQATLETTGQLVEVIRSAMPAAARREQQHPAKRSFQALRIAVNDELGELQALLHEGPKRLKAGGRLCIISFHSLEDRLVKQAFRTLEKPCICPRDLPQCACGKTSMGRVLTRRPLVADPEEAAANPRSRSAKVRCFERNDQPWQEGGADRV